MSVINKMLRDLDQRQAATPPVAAARAPAASELHRGIRSVPLDSKSENAWMGWRRVGFVLGGLMIAGGLGLGGWFATTRGPGGFVLETSSSTSLPATKSVQVAPAIPAVVASEPVAAAVQPIVAASSPELAPRVDVSPPPSVVPPSTAPSPAVSLRMEPMLSARKALNAVLSGSASATPAPTPSTTKANTPPSPAVGDVVSTGQRQQQASTDALQQAQTLWNAGSYNAAIDLMQQSVDAAERAAKAGTSAIGNPALLTLVRELMRMQMAQARYSAVWELLTRLEPVLGHAPDLWALRGNTAQRLGHHQDSVHAYRTALQARPDEQRWLLGVAVSLAALGQPTQAAEMAERARSVGVISPEVQAYLRQMGVPLKDK